MSKTRVLFDVKIECDPPLVFGRSFKSLEDVADEYEVWVRDFQYFIRDHRSQDPVSLTVIRDYKDVCSYCNNEWETDDDGVPCCCQNAVREYESEVTK